MGLLDDAADESSGEFADVDDKAAATLRQIIKTDYGILILRYDVVQPALVFEEIVYPGPSPEAHFGVAHDAGECGAVALALLQYVLHAGKHFWSLSK
jgi:hypothetical protein